jgi:hypothetical protein
MEKSFFFCVEEVLYTRDSYQVLLEMKCYFLPVLRIRDPVPF